MKVKLGDVCERGSSNLKQSDVIDKTGDFPIYGASGYIGNVDFYHQDKMYVAIVKDGAGIGRTMLLPAKSSVIGTMQYLLPKENIFPKYLYYVVKYMHLEKYFTGATIPHIYFRDYKNEEFNCETLEKQGEIVNTLEKVECIISARKQQLQQLDELVKARFVELFSSINDYKKLEYFSKLITKGASPKWQGIDYTDNGTLFVTSENVRDGFLDLSRKKYLDNKINEIQPRSVLKRNDVLINIVGASIGRAAIYDCDELANINQAVALVRVDFSLINQTYLMTYLNLPQAMEMYRQMKKGGARDNLSLKNISDLRIPNAPIDLQNEFANFVKEIDKSKFVQQNINEKIQFIFDFLMKNILAEVKND